MKTKNQFMQVQVQANQSIPQVQPTMPIKDALLLKASLQIKAAEYWLKLGEADLALRELEKLPSRRWTYGWALRTRIAAIGALRERSEVVVQN
jgi:hypothetical protein